MSIIDAHHHLLSTDKQYISFLIEKCKQLNISKVCLLGLPSYFGLSQNEEIEMIIKKYPFLFIGFAYFALGEETPSKIKKYKKAGFRGLKVINPPKNYDNKSFYSVYKEAEKLSMPIYFHLGIVARDDKFKNLDINCNRMRPIYLDTIARKFPNLYLLGAHFGNPWYEEAAAVARWNPNVYFDLTGSTVITKTPQELNKLLWWRSNSKYREPLGRHAWEKIIFGSDVFKHESIEEIKIEEEIENYNYFLQTLHLSSSLKNKIFKETIAKILAL